MLETAAANDTGATAQALALPGYLAGATLAAATDADVPLTDVVCEVFTDPALSSSLGGPSDDGDFAESWVTPPIPAGTTNVKLWASPGYTPSHKAYAAAIWLQ